MRFPHDWIFHGRAPEDAENMDNLPDEDTPIQHMALAALALLMAMLVILLSAASAR